MTIRRLIPLFLLIVAIGCGRTCVTGAASPEPMRGVDQVSAENSTSIPNKPLPSNGTESTQSSQPISPQIPAVAPDKPKAVKGIYVSAWKTNGASLDHLLKLLDETELNAMVIDIKTDTGQVTFDSQVPLANEIRSDDTKPIPNIRMLMQKLKQKGVYTIARVVSFKDPYLSGVRKDLAMKTKSGGIWHDGKGVTWVDPYKPEVQNYNIALAKEAAQYGFDEIQFDYVRFPENGKKVDQEVSFDNPQNSTKAELIRDFLKRAKGELAPIPVSADVFGLTSSTPDDMGIGQQWKLISPNIDYISPMIYPSHYGDGSLGVQHPDLQPYEIVRRAIKDAKAKNNELLQAHQPAAVIRPWLQDFTARWVKNHQVYGALQVKEQIKAAKEQGIDQFLLWNPSSTYSYQE